MTATPPTSRQPSKAERLRLRLDGWGIAIGAVAAILGGVGTAALTNHQASQVAKENYANVRSDFKLDQKIEAYSAFTEALLNDEAVTKSAIGVYLDQEPSPAEPVIDGEVAEQPVPLLITPERSADTVRDLQVSRLAIDAALGKLQLVGSEDAMLAAQWAKENHAYINLAMIDAIRADTDDVTRNETEADLLEKFDIKQVADLPNEAACFGDETREYFAHFARVDYELDSGDLDEPDCNVNLVDPELNDNTKTN